MDGTRFEGNSREDRHSLHRLISELYKSITHDDALPIVLRILTEHFRSRSAAFFYVDRPRPEADVALGHGVFDKETQRIYVERFAHLDPMPAIMFQLSIGEVIASDRLFSAEDLNALPFIRDFYYPLGLREILGGPIVNHANRRGFIIVNRGSERESFQDEEIRQFESIIPHLAQVVDLRRRFFEITDRAASLDGAMSATAMAVLVLTDDGCLSEANTAARSVLGRRDGLTLSRTGRLEALDAEANERLKQIWSRPMAKGAPIVMPISRARDAGPYTLRIAALDTMTASRSLIAQISDPDQSNPDPTALLMAALNLSRPSASLIATLLKGGDLKFYALQEQMSLDGAKYHLRAAFKATGTRRQADLIRITTGIVRDFAASL